MSCPDTCIRACLYLDALMPVHLYACALVHLSVSMPACLRTFIRAHLYLYASVPVPVCLHDCLPSYVRACTCMPACPCTCMPASMPVCLPVADKPSIIQQRRTFLSFFVASSERGNLTGDSTKAYEIKGPEGRGFRQDGVFSV